MMCGQCAQDVPPGKWVRPLGSDIEAGATVLAACERVGAAEIGILATVGAAHLQVTPALGVAFHADTCKFTAASLVTWLTVSSRGSC